MFLLSHFCLRPLAKDLQIHSLGLNQLCQGDIVDKVFENYLLISKITPQTLD